MDRQSIDNISYSFAKLGDEFAKLTRRIEQLQKSLDLLYEDRSILEDMQAGIRALQEVLLHNRKHMDNVVKDVKAEVIEQGMKVEDKVDSVKETVEDNISDLVQNIEKQENVVLIKEGLLKKFKRFIARR